MLLEIRMDKTERKISLLMLMSGDQTMIKVIFVKKKKVGTKKSKDDHSLWRLYMINARLQYMHMSIQVYYLLGNKEASWHFI